MSDGPKLPPYGGTSLDAGELVLCPWRDVDAAAIAVAHQDDAEIPRRTGFPYGMTDLQASAYILERRRGWEVGAKAAFGIFDREHSVLGSISLLEINWDRRDAEIGYWLARNARGRGVAVRALERIVRWAAELGLVRLTATVEVTNEASWRVLERARFVHQRTARIDRLLHGEWINEYVYARDVS